jgi:uncharacterized protein YegP (UPF0339 family)
MGYFVVKKVASGIKFDLKAGNHETIGTSEVYSSEKACMNGVASVQKNAQAAVEDQTVADYKKVSNPKFAIFVDKKGEFRFRLQAHNGEIILTSEGYTTKSGCTNGIASVRKNAVDAEIKKEG